MKKRLAKIRAHVSEYRGEYVIAGLTVTIALLGCKIHQQDKKLKGTTKMSMYKDDFRRMHEEGGWMVWDAKNGFGPIVLGVTEQIQENGDWAE